MSQTYNLLILELKQIKRRIGPKNVAKSQGRQTYVLGGRKLCKRASVQGSNTERKKDIIYVTLFCYCVLSSKIVVTQETFHHVCNKILAHDYNDVRK